uniref:Regulator of chromosome condensation n=1 Tax=Trypanosoma congolense (strain IL3000) TaxID=1068625 RepID=G0ULA9_TRYCI|nr:conserved hypothetical protein [Trypanosoma congolense IL3000]
MIRDAEFWMEARRQKNGGNTIFTTLLPLLHARQVALDSGVRANGLGTASVSVPPVKKPRAQEPYDENKVLQSSVSESTMRVLQQVMMFAVPMYPLQYNITAMSMSSKTSSIVDRETKQLITFGAGEGVRVPQHIKCRGCVAGDDFFAILTDQEEVWASGGLHVMSCENGTWTGSPLGKADEMKVVASGALMAVGNGQRLACLTRSLTVQPLSLVSNPVTSIFPFRHLRFLDMSYGDDYFMIGMDSVLYKTVASRRALGTPRRVMTLCRTTVSRVASGMGFYVFIDQNGQLYTIGVNSKGQLGNGQKQYAQRKAFLHKALTHHYFVSVAAGTSHSLALSSSGTAYAAGSNDSGQLGLGEHVAEALTFTPVLLPTRCVGIAAGPKGSMFACVDGRVYTCGLNDHRQLGLDVDVSAVYIPTPIQVVTGGVEAYTMDYGTCYKPIVTLRRQCPTLTTSQASGSVSNGSDVSEGCVAAGLSSIQQSHDAHRVTSAAPLAGTKDSHASGRSKKEKSGESCKTCCTMF